MKRIRAVAIIIKDQKVLLMHRIKNGREYFVFPGGKVEAGETPEQAVIREVKEEVSLDIHSISKVVITRLNDTGDEEIYYEVRDFSGEVKLGGEEKEQMDQYNQYIPEWWNIEDALKLESMYPHDTLSLCIKYTDSQE